VSLPFVVRLRTASGPLIHVKKLIRAVAYRDEQRSCFEQKICAKNGKIITPKLKN